MSRNVHWLLVLLFFCSVFLSRCRVPALTVVYSSAFEEIRVENGYLTCIERQHHYPPDRPMVATPDSITSRVVVDRKALSGRRQKQLRNLIESSGFFLLNNIYGAPEGQRFYPYSIEVHQKGKTREVLYRSNPEYAPEPEAFGRVREGLLRLVEELSR